LLSDSERRLIDQAPLRYMSAVTLWEIAILASLGRIPADDRLYTLPQGLELLPVDGRHCQELSSLPHLHRDPFDRMLIAQARIDDLVLVTRDTRIIGYGAAGAICAKAAP
jgi:PIN domain nuclease of toxin-antitoxin system